MRFSAVPDPERALREVASLRPNYDAATTGEPGWHHDRERRTLAHEAPGDPEPDGPWESACRMVRDYEFAEPTIMHAYFHRDAELLGRDMLLEGRFVVARFPMGVRVDTVVDETRPRADGTRERAWGWSYRTLEHHLERGRLLYEVVKNLDTGRVEFVVTGTSRQASIANPLVALGFLVFGRWTQRRFYRAVMRRLQTLVTDVGEGADLPTPDPAGPGDLVIAPSAERRRPGRALARRFGRRPN